MFSLRRAAVRALQYQPCRQSFTLRPVSATFETQKPVVFRSFHKTIRLAEEEQQKQGGSGQTEITDIKEEAKGQAQSAAETLQQTFSSAADTIKNAVSGATNSNEAPRSSGNVVYVGNLFFEVTPAQLEAHFARFGEVLHSRIVTDPRGMSKGFGFVEFANFEAAERAVKALDQEVFEGRRIAVQHHVARERRARNSFNTGPTETLFIGNLSFQMSDRDLNDLFKEMRNVLDVRVAVDRRSGQPRGFAHADFIDVESATKAKEALDDMTVFGRKLRVDYGTPPAKRRAATRSTPRESDD